jgi:uncharacterized protein (DUF885 family)
MKRILLTLAVAGVLSSCGNNDTSKQATNQTEMAHDATEQEEHGDHEAASASGTASVDGPVRKSDQASAILDGYLAMKDALASDNSAKAAASGEMMVKAFARFDRASLDPKQQVSYDEIVDDAREHAEHIGTNGGKIDHQREHFDALSKDMTDLIAVVGSDRTLYQDYCPMFNDKKGANWLSTSREIKNPYMGSKMSTCGSMKTEIVPQ